MFFDSGLRAFVDWEVLPGLELDAHHFRDEFAKILTESARDPEIAAILQSREAEERDLTVQFRQRLRRPGWTQEEP